MRVIVLGSGVIGVTTAFMLAERGHQVTVIERQRGAAMETSFANGGQLSYSHAEPWATPSVLPKVVKWFGKKDAPLVFRFTSDWRMWYWGMQFLANCTNNKARYNTANTLRLALYSRQILAELREKTHAEFAYSNKGILHIFQDGYGLEASLKQAEFQATLGGHHQLMSTAECLAKEPALKSAIDAGRVHGGIFYPDDESGDIFQFTKQISDLYQQYNIDFKYNTTVEAITTQGDGIDGIKTDKGHFTADCYVVAMGSYSPIYLRKIGVHLPIYPMKGYSISIPIKEGSVAPETSITDQSKKLVYSRLGNILRVAGTAEFARYDTLITPHRIESLTRAASELFPQAGDFSNISPWACLRPSTPAGTPILGRSKYSNLFLNTGHGTLGWTLAAGSSRIVADIIEGKKPEIDLTGLTIRNA